MVASEIDPFGVTAIGLNAELNGTPPIEVVGDLLGGGPPDVDVVLAGDVCYDRGDVGAGAAVPGRRPGGRGAEVFLGDPGRPYVPHDRLTAVATFDVPDTEGPAGPPDDGVAAALIRARDMHHVWNSGPRIVTTR